MKVNTDRFSLGWAANPWVRIGEIFVATAELLDCLELQETSALLKLALLELLDLALLELLGAMLDELRILLDEDSFEDEDSTELDVSSSSMIMGPLVLLLSSQAHRTRDVKSKRQNFFILSNIIFFLRRGGYG